MMKYSWKRSSLVSSGWNVVRRWRPWRSATTVESDCGSVSSSSCGTRVWDAGSSDAEMRDMIMMGGSVTDGVSASTTWWAGVSAWRLGEYEHGNSPVHG